MQILEWKSIYYFQEADLGIGTISVTAERAQVIEFTYTFTEDGKGIVMQKPSGQHENLVGVFAPLPSNVWILILVSVFVISIILCTANYVMPTNQLIYLGQQPYQKQILEDDGSVDNSNNISCTAGSGVAKGNKNNLLEITNNANEEEGHNQKEYLANDGLRWNWSSETKKSLWFVFSSLFSQGMYNIIIFFLQSLKLTVNITLD